MLSTAYDCLLAGLDAALYVCNQALLPRIPKSQHPVINLARGNIRWEAVNIATEQAPLFFHLRDCRL